MNIIAKALRPLSLADLKTVEAKLEAQIATLPVAQIKVIRTLFYDVVAMIGTNPAVMLVKERLLDATKYVKFDIAMKIEFNKILILRGFGHKDAIDTLFMIQNKREI